MSFDFLQKKNQFVNFLHSQYNFIELIPNVRWHYRRYRDLDLFLCILKCSSLVSSLANILSNYTSIKPVSWSGLNLIQLLGA